MLTTIRYNKNAGNAAIYSRLRNVDKAFWNFNTLAWVTPEVAACRIYLTEGPDSDPDESLYAAEVLVPTGGPWIIEAVLAVTGACLGGEVTPPTPPDNQGIADIQAAVANIPTNPLLSDDVRLDFLDAAITSRSTFNGGTVAAVSAGVTLAADQDIRNVTGTIMDKTDFALTAAYDPAKTAATQASVNAIAADVQEVQGIQLDIGTGINLLLEGQTELRNIAKGDWELLNNQMILYAPGGVEIVRFNLFNAAGEPTTAGAFKRVSV